MRDNQLPEWLLYALERTSVPVVAPRTYPLHRGAIVRILPMDGVGEARLAVVLDDAPSHNAIGVAIASNETEMATEFDLRVEPDETGLPFALVMESDTQGTVWTWQVEVIGTVTADSVDELERIVHRAPSVLSMGRRGLPLSGRDDPRWTWKEQELDELRALAADCVGALLSPPVLDTAILNDPDFDGFRSERVLDAVQALTDGVAIADESLVAFGDLTTTKALLSREERLALAAALIEAAGGAQLSDHTASMAPLEGRSFSPSLDSLRPVVESPHTRRIYTWPAYWTDRDTTVLRTTVAGRIHRTPLVVNDAHAAV